MELQVLVDIFMCGLNLCFLKFLLPEPDYRFRLASFWESLVGIKDEIPKAVEFLLVIDVLYNIIVILCVGCEVVVPSAHPDGKRAICFFGILMILVGCHPGERVPVTFLEEADWSSA